MFTSARISYVFIKLAGGLNHGSILTLCILWSQFGSGSFHFEREKGERGWFLPRFLQHGEEKSLQSLMQEEEEEGDGPHSCLTLPF